MHFNNSLYNHLIIPFKVQNLLGIDLDPDALLDLGHEHGPGDAPRLVVQLAQVQVCLVLLQQQLGPGVCGARVQPKLRVYIKQYILHLKTLNTPSPGDVGEELVTEHGLGLHPLPGQPLQPLALQKHQELGHAHHKVVRRVKPLS